MRLNRLYDAYAKKGFQLVVISPHEINELEEAIKRRFNP